MKISLSSVVPLVWNGPQKISVAGDILTVDDEVFDFTPLAEGSVLPEAAIASDVVRSSVTRQDGHIVLTLRFDVAADAEYSARFPEMITVTEDGPVTLPPAGPETEQNDEH